MRKLRLMAELRCEGCDWWLWIYAEGRGYASWLRDTDAGG